MAKVRNGKINKNLNIRTETVQRIIRLRKILLVSSVGDIIDLAVAKLMNSIEGDGYSVIVMDNEIKKYRDEPEDETRLSFKGEL